jgi:hypothetical protein
MIITRILEPSGTNAQIEVRDHGFPTEADMAFSPTIDRARSPRLPHRGTATGGEDSTFLRRSRLGGICVAALVLIALIIFMIPALVPGCLGSRVLSSGILECRVPGQGLPSA